MAATIKKLSFVILTLSIRPVEKLHPLLDVVETKEFKRVGKIK